MRADQDAAAAHAFTLVIQHTTEITQSAPGDLVPETPSIVHRVTNDPQLSDAAVIEFYKNECLGVETMALRLPTIRERFIALPAKVTLHGHTLTVTLARGAQEQAWCWRTWCT